MVDRFLKLRSDGLFEESTPIATSGGAGDADKLVRTGADGRFSDTVMPEGLGAETETMVASEALTANDVVNVYDDGGTRKCRKADASDHTKPAHGFVIAGVSQGGNAVVYFDGKLPGTALTIGAIYFLSETAGAVTATRPTTDAAMVQKIGMAVSTTAIIFEPGMGTIVDNPA